MPRVTLAALCLCGALIGQVAGLSTSRAERVRCGPNDCESGEVCCNYGCGICVPADSACILPLCYWGRPDIIEPAQRPDTDIYDRVHGRLSLSDVELRPSGFLPTSLTGYTAAIGVQHYLRERTAVRAQVVGTQLGDSNLAPGGHTRGLSLSAGASYHSSLRPRHRWLRWAGLLDAELALGPNPQPVLAPTVLTDLRVTSVGAGFALASGFNSIPVSAHLRYVQSFVEGGDRVGYIDVGVSVGADLHTLQLPFGVRASYRFSQEVTDGDYRAFEIDGGLYYSLRSRELRLGLDGGAVFVRVGPTLDARTLRAVLRLDWYWDARD